MKIRLTGPEPIDDDRFCARCAHESHWHTGLLLGDPTSTCQIEFIDPCGFDEKVGLCPCTEFIPKEGEPLIDTWLKPKKEG